MRKDAHPKPPDYLRAYVALGVFASAMLGASFLGPTLIQYELSHRRVEATAQYMQTPEVRDSLLATNPISSTLYSFELDMKTDNYLNDSGGTALAYKVESGTAFFVTARHVAERFSLQNTRLIFSQPQLLGSSSIEVTTGFNWSLHPQKDLAIFTVPTKEFTVPADLRLKFSEAYRDSENCSMMGFAGATEKYDGWHVVTGLSINWLSEQNEIIMVHTNKATNGGDSGGVYFCSDEISGVHSSSNPFMGWVGVVPLIEQDIQDLEKELKNTK